MSGFKAKAERDVIPHGSVVDSPWPVHTLDESVVVLRFRWSDCGGWANASGRWLHLACDERASSSGIHAGQRMCLAYETEQLELIYRCLLGVVTRFIVSERRSIDMIDLYMVVAALGFPIVYFGAC